MERAGKRKTGARSFIEIEDAKGKSVCTPSEMIDGGMYRKIGPLYAAPVPAIPEGWISMKDQQPEPGHHCLFHVPLNGYQDYRVAGFIDDRHPDADVYDLCGETQGIDVSDIENWMPLSPPPKNKE